MHESFGMLASASSISSFLDWVPSQAVLIAVVRALVVVTLSVALGRLAIRLIFRAAARWAARSQSTLDDLVLDKLRRPADWFGPVLAARLALPIAALPPSLNEPIRHALLIAAIVIVAWLVTTAIRITESIIQLRLKLREPDNLVARQLATSTRGLRNLADFAVFILSLGFVLMTFDSVRQIGGTLLASAGVAGLVIGFAAQKSIATVLAGIQIAVTQPIRVDDVVIVEGEWGRVEEITLTFVVIAIWDKRRLVVPIQAFLEKPFQNWTRQSAELLGTVELYLDYGVDLSELRAELDRVLNDTPLWDRKVKSVQVTAASERAMTVRALFSAKNSSEQWDLRCLVRERLIKFVHANYPEALPRLRAEVQSTEAAPLATPGQPQAQAVD